MDWKLRIALAVVAALCLSGAVDTSAQVSPAAGKPAALLGSPSFRPTPEQPVGWRGDGTGHFPDATPPLTWGRWPRILLGLRCQAPKPASEPGPLVSTTALGLLSEWLVAGPFPAADAAAAMEQEILPGEAALDPDQGAKAGDSAWKAHRPAVPYLDLAELLPKKDGAHVAYALTRVYAPTARTLTVSLNSGARAWLNGSRLVLKDKPKEPSTSELALAKGWNRLLVKLAAANPKEWKLSVRLNYPTGNADYETTNIAWAVKTPNNNWFRNAAQSVVIGDNLYASIETMGLICLNRKDGKVLWLRFHTLADGLTDDERKSIPNWAEIQTLIDKLHSLEAAILSDINGLTAGDPFSLGPVTPFVSAPLAKRITERAELEKKINKAVGSALPKGRLNTYDRHDGGVAAPTPVTDGQRLYVWYANGVILCYTLDGKPVWSKAIDYGNGEHGNSASPVLVGDLLIGTMRGTVVAFRKTDGSLVWEQKGQFHHGSVLAAQAAGEPAVISATGRILRARDGTPLGDELRGGTGWDTPIVERSSLYYFISRGDAVGGFFYAATLPAAPGTKLVTTAKIELPKGSLWDGWFNSSMLYHDGLVYAVNALGILRVYDFQAAKLVYQQQLDVHPAIQYVVAPGVSASPAIAGKYIYITDNHNTTVILEPGRTYKPLAKNTIHFDPGSNTVGWGRPLGQEQVISSPIFSGHDIYLVGGDYIYCVRNK